MGVTCSSKTTPDSGKFTLWEFLLWILIQFGLLGPCLTLTDSISPLMGIKASSKSKSNHLACPVDQECHCNTQLLQYTAIRMHNWWIGFHTITCFCVSSATQRQPLQDGMLTGDRKRKWQLWLCSHCQHPDRLINCAGQPLITYYCHVHQTAESGPPTGKTLGTEIRSSL